LRLFLSVMNRRVKSSFYAQLCRFKFQIILYANLPRIKIPISWFAESASALKLFKLNGITISLYLLYDKAKVKTSDKIEGKVIKAAFFKILDLLLQEWA
jgi:hypothetical protein